MGQRLRSTAAFRLRETKRLRRSADAQSNKAIGGRRGKHCQRIQYARAARENEVVAEGGSWQQAARAVAVSDGSAALPIMPPSFAGLNDAQCLNDISQMYGFLQHQQWFHPRRSVVLGAQETKNVNRWYIESSDDNRAAALSFLERNYPEDVRERIIARLVDNVWKRDVTICSSCEPHIKDNLLTTLAAPIRLCDYAVDPVYTQTPVSEESQALPVVYERWQDHASTSDQDDAELDQSSSQVLIHRQLVIGRSVEDFASAVALLTDHEEMVIALVHPLVQVYTIPRTGQLAYVGHICNFRQKVAKFLKSLPIPNNYFPFVMVRPRSLRNRPSGKAPFKVDVHKLRHAFYWLKQNNPYYDNVEWNEVQEAEWKDNEISVGTTREEDVSEGLGLQVTGDICRLWLRESAINHAAGEAGFPMGNRLLALLDEDLQPGSASVCEGDEENVDSVDPWNLLRTKIATTMKSNLLRAATALPDLTIAVFMHLCDQFDLGAPPSGDPQDVMTYLRGMPETDWTEDVTLLHSELHVIRTMLSAEEPMQFAGAVSALESTEDLSLRSGVLDDMAECVTELFGQEKQATTDGGEEDKEMELGPPEATKVGIKQLKHPRVDPPEVEDEPGQGIPENTPWYIFFNTILKADKVVGGFFFFFEIQRRSCRRDFMCFKVKG